MTEKDKQRILIAECTHFYDWGLVLDLENDADTKEAREILHDIRVDYVAREKALQENFD